VTEQVAAEVRLHGRRVGELAFDRGGSVFRYDDDLTVPDHQVLGQVFEDDPQSIRRARTGLPPWFANLLPEGEMRRQVVADLGGGNVGDYTLLLRLGGYLPGAVTVHAEREPEDDPHDLDGGTVPEHPLRHAQAGVQLKYTTVTGKLTFPASGKGGWWTVKLPDRGLPDLTVNEYLTMRWLDAAGFPVPPVHLEPAASVGGIPAGMVGPRDLVYLVERFDRTAAGRVHFEDFAQVADVDPLFKYGERGASYDSIAAVVRFLAGERGYQDFIGRLVAMLVTGNTDAHLKNWSLLYADGRTPELSPVYDFHSLTVYGRFRYAPLALSLNREKGPAAIGIDDFRRLGDRAGADPERTAEYALAAVDRLRSSWRQQLASEAAARMPDLARHYSGRLEALAICAI
jgi:serine/threonine-protein kinase HipA